VWLALPGRLVLLATMLLDGACKPLVHQLATQLVAMLLLPIRAVMWCIVLKATT